MEAVIALAALLQNYSFTILEGHEIGMTTGATIHTTNGLYMNVIARGSDAATAKQPELSSSVA